MKDQNLNLKGANLPRSRNALGRGLSALMSAAAVSVDFANKSAENTGAPNLEVIDGKLPASTEPLNQKSQEVVMEANLEGGLIYLSLDRVYPNKSQPRQSFRQEEIDTLAESIRQSGLLQPIVVRRRSAEGSGQLSTYEIIAGERRFRAAKQAGLVKIPALLRQLSDREALEIGIVENVQRADLNPIEEAFAYQRLATEFNASQQEIAEKVGKDRTSIANSLRLLKLPEEIKQLLIKGKMSAGHGRAILLQEDSEQQKFLANRILEEGLSVREAERLARNPDSLTQSSTDKVRELKSAPEVQVSDPNHSALEERVRRALGTKVKLILGKAGSGELRVSFFSQAELERILDRIA